MNEEKINLLKNFFKKKHITQMAIAERTGMSQPQVNRLLSGKDNFGKHTAVAFANEFGLSAVWLMTGDGDMFSAQQPQSVNMRNVPVIDLDSKGGFLVNEVTDMTEHTVSVMPFSSDIAHEGDFFMPVSGDSMSPKYPSGCLVLLREIEMWREYLELGLCYTLLLKDGRRVIKDVQAGSDRDHVKLCSVNPSYDPVEVSRDFIDRVFMVVLCIRKEVI